MSKIKNISKKLLALFIKLCYPINRGLSMGGFFQGGEFLKEASVLKLKNGTENYV